MVFCIGCGIAMEVISKLDSMLSRSLLSFVAYIYKLGILKNRKYIRPSSVKRSLWRLMKIPALSSLIVLYFSVDRYPVGIKTGLTEPERISRNRNKREYGAVPSCP